MYKVKIFNKFREISGKIGLNFWKFPEMLPGKFPEIFKLTTLDVGVQNNHILCL